MRCKGCNAEIEVKWIVPIGTTTPILESLCYACLVWVETAKTKGGPVPPTARRRPIRRNEEIDNPLDLLDNGVSWSDISFPSPFERRRSVWKKRSEYEEDS